MPQVPEARTPPPPFPAGGSPLRYASYFFIPPSDLGEAPPGDIFPIAALKHRIHTAAEHRFKPVDSVLIGKGGFVDTDKIRVLRGIEMGQPTYDIDLTEKSLARYEYDFVIGSIHNLRNMPDFGDLDYKSMSEERIYELLGEYFDYLQLVALGVGGEVFHLSGGVLAVAGGGYTGVDCGGFHIFKNVLMRECVNALVFLIGVMKNVLRKKGKNEKYYFGV